MISSLPFEAINLLVGGEQEVSSIHNCLIKKFYILAEHFVSSVNIYFFTID